MFFGNPRSVQCVSSCGLLHHLPVRQQRLVTSTSSDLPDSRFVFRIDGEVFEVNLKNSLKTDQTDATRATIERAKQFLKE